MIVCNRHTSGQSNGNHQVRFVNDLCLKGCVRRTCGIQVFLQGSIYWMFPYRCSGQCPQTILAISTTRQEIGRRNTPPVALTKRHLVARCCCWYTYMWHFSSSCSTFNGMFSGSTHQPLSLFIRLFVGAAPEALSGDNCGAISDVEEIATL